MPDKHNIIKLRRGTAAEWAASEPQPGGEVLKLGEPGYEKDTKKLKIGDGITPWNSLPYISGDNGDITINPEDIQDIIGNGFLVSGSGINISYNDNLNSLTISTSGVSFVDHTHTSSQIIDSTSFGRNILTASSYEQQNKLGWVINSSNFTAVAGGQYLFPTTASVAIDPIVISDPPSASDGDFYFIVKSTNSTRPITIGGVTYPRATGVILYRIYNTDTIFPFSASWKTYTLDTFHTHTSSQITDFNSSVSGLLPVRNVIGGSYISVSSSSGNFTVSATGLQPSGNYSTTGHSHVIADVSGLQNVLDNKQPSGSYAPLVHSHVSSDITNFNSSVSGLLPVTNILSGAGISVSNSSGVYTIEATGSGILSDQAKSLVTTVFNKTGSPIPKMSAVYINGGQGDLPTVSLAIATSDMTSAGTYGLTYETIPNMQSGKVIVFGALTGLDTDQFNPTAPQGNVNGSVLYLSPSVSGSLTLTKPSAPNHIVAIGTIVRTHQNEGVVEVRVQNGFELEELHNVAISGVADGQFLQYNSGTQLWVPSSSGNFTTLQVDGTNVSISGHTHTSSDITNLVYAAGDGFASIVGSGTDNSATGEHSVVNGGAANVAVGQGSVVGGGFNNTSTGATNTIGGGASNTADGYASTVGGGEGITAAADYSVVGGGANNVASGQNSVIAGGNTNNAGGQNSVISGGHSNVALGENSVIIGGKEAVAGRYGMTAFATGKFLTQGDAQRVQFLLRNETTDDTPTNLFLDGSAIPLEIPFNKALFATIAVAGVSDSTNKFAHYVRKVAVNNNNDVVTFIGNVSTIGADTENDAAYDVSISVEDNTLRIIVTGKADETIRWLASVDGIEMSYTPGEPVQPPPPPPPPLPILWSQQGDDIDGSSAGDNAGWGVSLNAAGNVAVIGSPGSSVDGNPDTGRVKVYVWDGTSWTQRGNDIEGENDPNIPRSARSGQQVSINDAGDVIAIVAISGSNQDVPQRIYTKIYAWNGSSWVQRGATLSGFGSSASLDSTGNSVAVGNHFYDLPPPNTSAGLVRVYDWNGVSWVQRGQDLTSGRYKDFFGYSVSLNSTADVLAVGAAVTRLENGSTTVASRFSRVYEWNGTQWVQRGVDFVDNEYLVSLNADGSILALAHPTATIPNSTFEAAQGRVRVYEWTGSNWVQVGSDIYGVGNQAQSGTSLSLNDAGDVLAIGAYGQNHTRVYTWNGTEWSQQSAAITGEASNDWSGRSVSLNSAGTVLIIGAPLNDDNGVNSGHALIYNLVSP